MSYLPQLKEEVGTLAKNPKVRIAIAVILVCLVFASGWLLCRYYDRTAAADGADVTRTVQSVKDDNQRARDSIGTATEQIRQAGQQLDSVTDSIDAGQRTVDENKAIIDDSSLSQANEALKQQSQSLETLTEQIKSAEHKQAVTKRQRDMWAGAAGILLIGCIVK